MMFTLDLKNSYADRISTPGAERIVIYVGVTRNNYGMFIIWMRHVFLEFHISPIPPPPFLTVTEA